ncbi:hypothetical protein PI124_g1619 [Phytophthora idaei]|nr:hypothetical protein PI125_g1 [Phytophthora idaei]KAG3172215.1 hypothetical protein PI126_g1527 [Phytophthora idaei]KAG3253804.1 hypothetical protein PI124_g1619 [Phytophthora idaei]
MHFVSNWTWRQLRARENRVIADPVEETRPLQKYRTSIGFRANHRVDDDPILRCTTSARPGGTDGENGDSELAKNNGLQIDSVAVEEVAEFVLRLVVGRLCDSELLFHALKSDVGFSQMYKVFSELKSLPDSRHPPGSDGATASR